MLEEFHSLSETRCNILIDKDGLPITTSGDVDGIDLDTISALVAGSFAATAEMAKHMGDGDEEFSVLFHQGKKDNIQLALIGKRCILVTIFDDRTTIGMVRLYSKEATKKLLEVFDEIAKRDPNDVPETIGDDFAGEQDGALDDLFGAD